MEKINVGFKYYKYFIQTRKTFHLKLENQDLFMLHISNEMIFPQLVNQFPKPPFNLIRIKLEF